MKRFFILAALLSISVPHAIAAGREIKKVQFREASGGREVEVVAGEVLVKLRAAVPARTVTEFAGRHKTLGSLEIAGEIQKLNTYRVTLREGQSLQQAIEELRKDPSVLMVEPNAIARVMGDVVPNDPLYPQQWGLKAVRAPEAWELTMGAPSVVVAVIDTGVDLDHPDLRNNLLPGYNVLDANASPEDDHGHGTYCAGIIGAEGDNDIGIIGVAPKCKLLPIKALDSNGEGTYADVASAIIYAADHGASILNLSFGGYAYSQILQNAVDYALEHGCILVAAAGNDGIDQPVYPAAYPDIIGVAALGENGEIWRSSNHGSHIDVSAPGEKVISTGLKSEFTVSSGTSAACSFVSGIASLVRTQQQGLPSSAISRIIERHSSNAGTQGPNKVYPNRFVDACQRSSKSAVI